MKVEPKYVHQRWNGVTFSTMLIYCYNNFTGLVSYQKNFSVSCQIKRCVNVDFNLESTLSK